MGKNIPRLIALFCATLFFSFSFAQKKISGVVTDDKQAALAGASVVVKGTKVATSTDASGKFTLTVPDNAKTLVVSFIGMQTQELTIGEHSVVAISLVSSSST